MPPLKILLLAANPEAKNLRLDAEQREIEERVELGERRRQKQAVERPTSPIEIIRRGASRLSDLLTELQLHKPQALHFSGHGAAGGELIFEDYNGRRTPVAPEVLANILADFRSDLRLVFLNACYSHQQAAGIVRNIDCFIGMTRTIEDPSALAFAGTFYHLVALGSSVGRAFRLAREDMVVMDAGGSPRDVSCLLTREGVNADEVLLMQPQHSSSSDNSSIRTPAGGLSNSQLRRELNKVLPADASLNAFLWAKYPRIAKETGDNMQRTVKITILLTYEKELSRLWRNLSEFCHESEV